MFSRYEAQVPQEFVSAQLLCFKGSSHKICSYRGQGVAEPLFRDMDI